MIRGKVIGFSIFGIIALVVLILGIFTATTYNRAVKISNQIPTDLASIGIAMEARYQKMDDMMDAITQYDATVLAYISNITAARTAYVNALSAGNLDGMADAEATLDGAFDSLAIFLEDNPAYMGTSLYLQYLNEVSASANVVAESKEKYNESVQEFNTLVQSFPANLVISMFGYESGQFPLYEVELS